MKCDHPVFCAVLPPHMLEAMMLSPDARVRASAMGTMLEGERLRGQRDILSQMSPMEMGMAGEYKLTYDANQRTALPGTLVWQEGQPLTRRSEVDEATEGTRITYELLNSVFGRKGLDGANMRMISTVRYGRRYNNAFWQGFQMVYGLGDGYLFTRFTAALDVCAHELAHGLTQKSNGLQYYGQSGALNEHFSDVLGIMATHYKKQQDATPQADWTLGTEIFTARVRARGLRDMQFPGTAYSDPNIGNDPQPDRMSNYYKGENDSGGVHINSGIPNRAFALAAIAIGGKSYDGAGQAWFRAHTKGGIPPWCEFKQYAETVVRAAGEIWGPGSKQTAAVKDAWSAVEIL